MKKMKRSGEVSLVRRSRKSANVGAASRGSAGARRRRTLRRLEELFLSPRVCYAVFSLLEQPEMTRSSLEKSKTTTF